MRVRIWSNEHRAYWRPNGCGYTTEPEMAGMFDAEDAVERTRHCGPEKQICICPDNHHVTLRRDEFEKWYREGYARTRRELTPALLRPNLEELLRRAVQHVMTPEEVFEQRVSFVYGNLVLDGVQMTKEQVRKVALEMYGSPRALDPQMSGNWSA